jgi:hypothetical protein
MKRALVAATLTILGALSLVSSISCDRIDAAFDCQAVCERYRDCYNSSYDVGGCESRCRSNAANDPNAQQEADACDACIGDKSCASATFNCGTTCGTIVP